MSADDRRFKDEDYFSDRDKEDYPGRDRSDSSSFYSKEGKYEKDKSFDYEEEDNYEFEKKHGYEDNLKSRKDRFSDDFFKDDDFDYSDEEETPSGQDPDDYSIRSKRVKSKRKKRKIITSVILIIILIAVLATGAFFISKFIKNRVSEGATEISNISEDPIDVPANLQLTEDVSMVVAGAGENLLEPDINFIFYGKFESKNNKLTTLTIPVKTLMDIPGFGLESADKAVEFGGMDLLILTLKKALGLDLDKYIIFNIKDIADKLDGITVNIEADLTVFNYQNESPIELKQGDNVLKGIEAVSYLKYFSGTVKDVPITNTVNQKKVFDSMILKIAGDSDKDLEKNLNLIKNLLETNLTNEELFKLIATITKLSPENNTVYALDVTPVELEGGNIFYVPDPSKLAQIFSIEPITENTEPISKVTADLQVLNGAGTPGIAGKTADLFKDLKWDDGSAKFNILQPKDADNYNYSTTQIIVNSTDPSYMALAEEIRAVLNVGNIVQKEDAPAQNIVVIVGADYTAGSSTQTTQAIDAPVKINVLNGVGVAGLAKKAKQQLESSLNSQTALIEVIETKDAANFNYTQTEIIFFQNTDQINNIAQQIQKALGAGVIKFSESNPDNVGISVILGKDYS